jgi:LysR family transcriptional regulator, pca operon transcriptional activator
MESNKLRQIKLRHLSAFVETIRCGSMKFAAARIYLTQPAISKTLKDLETILGARLLERDRGGITLTREGAVFRQFAEQGLAALSHGITSLDAMGAGAAVPLQIGALPSVAADLLPDVILGFDDLSPATPVTVEDGPIGALVDRLRSGDLDLVIGRMGRPDTMNGLSFTQLYSEQVVFAVSADHPLAQCDSVAALADWRVLYPPKGAAIRPLVDRFMIARGISEWRNRLDTVSGAFGRSMTLGPAQAVWIISQGVVSRDIAAGRMVTLPIDSSEMVGPVGILARSEEDPTPAMRLFRQVLLDRAARVRGPD